MLKTTIGKIATTALVAGILVCGLAGCQDNGGGTAATVNGVVITEQEVNDEIQAMRERVGATSEKAWGTYLASTASQSPAEVREGVINTLVNQKLVRQFADEHGIKISDEDIAVYVDAMKSNYDDESTWTDALKTSGMTEDKYKESIEYGRIQDTVIADMISTAATEKAGEKDFEDAELSMVSYIDGSKRSSHILFAADDKETAEQVLAQIKDGSIDFDAAAKQYSIDKNSAKNGGDVGWNRLNTFPQEYSDALETLDKGGVSELVTTEYGIHIIKVTDVFTAPAEGVTSLSDVPKEFHSLLAQFASASAASEDYSNWFSTLIKNADITVNSMPENAPYNLDYDKYKADYEAEQAAQNAANTTSTSTTSGTTADSSGITEVTTDENGNMVLNTSGDDSGTDVETTSGTTNSASNTASNTSGSSQ